MHTETGTLSARAIAKCSLDIPISPAFAATIKITNDGDPEVRPKAEQFLQIYHQDQGSDAPYRVVLRYRS